jgi:hypothetical protein
MSKSVLIAIPLLASANPAIAAPRDCLEVVHAWRDATDFQEVGNISDFTWEDGYSQWPGSEKTKWSAVNPSGPPKYNTTLREIRVSPTKGARQSVRLKAITRRVDMNPDTGAFDFYTGDYTVSKVNYTCERRSGQWKILWEVVTQRVDLQNKVAAQRYEKLKQS